MVDLPTPDVHHMYMQQALRQAHLAYEMGEIPVGAVIVNNGKVIGRGYNQVQTLKDPTAHAEMIAITSACHFLGAKYLPDSTLYVTLEPCFMCAGAIKWAQLATIVFGARDVKAGYSTIAAQSLFPAKTAILGGILETECQQLILTFFQSLRNK